MHLPQPSHYLVITHDAYFGAFALICLCELLVCRRSLAAPMHARWLVNIALAVINTLVLRGLFSMLGVAVAVVVRQQGMGLFNYGYTPPALAIAVSILGMDLAFFGWHWLAHQVPLFWRFHRIHHSDIDVDLTTDLRHHPVEAFLSTAVLILATAILGAPPFGVFLFVLLQSIVSLWEHANIRIPAVVDRVVRWVLVTPDMHRIHHSADKAETDSNYTMLFSFWDRLFGTYRSTPAFGHEGMILGLPYLRDSADQRLGRILLLPFHPTVPSEIRPV